MISQMKSKQNGASVKCFLNRDHINEIFGGVDAVPTQQDRHSLRIPQRPWAPTASFAPV